MKRVRFVHGLSLEYLTVQRGTPLLPIYIFHFTSQYDHLLDYNTLIRYCRFIAAIMSRPAKYIDVGSLETLPRAGNNTESQTYADALRLRLLGSCSVNGSLDQQIREINCGLSKEGFDLMLRDMRDYVSRNGFVPTGVDGSICIRKLDLFADFILQPSDDSLVFGLETEHWTVDGGIQLSAPRALRVPLGPYRDMFRLTRSSASQGSDSKVGGHIKPTDSVITRRSGSIGDGSVPFQETTNAQQTLNAATSSKLAETGPENRLERLTLLVAEEEEEGEGDSDLGCVMV